MDSKKNKVVFPEKLYLESEDEKIVKYINEAEKLDKPNFDFSKVMSIDVGSALYVKAYIDYVKETKKEYKISCSTKNQKMRQILQHMNIFDYGIEITHEDIMCWEMRTWSIENKENYGKIMMKEILPKVLKGKVPSEEFAQIAGNLNELLANCSEHAYTEKYFFRNFYLIAGEYKTEKEASNTFSFCILDSGQGFKSSISNYGTFDKLLSSLTSMGKPDSELLKATVDGKFNADKNKNSGRGTGLSEVAKSVKMIRGDMYLYSDKGCFNITSDGEEILRERKNKAIGSIIEIILPISERGITRV